VKTDFMKKILYMLMLAIAGPAFSQGYLHQDGQRIKDGDNNEILLRGLGLGGWMVQEGYMLQTASFAGSQHEIRQKITDLIGAERTEAFYQSYRDNGITKRDIDSLKAWGFNSVRLPMHYNLYTMPIELEPVAGQNTWLEEGFTRTDQLLEWCKENEMYLILDMHAAPGGQGKDANISDYDSSKPSLWESEANRQKMVALWRRLADRYKNEPWVGAYDLINEPNWNFTGTNQNGCDEGSNIPLRQLMVDITAAIREVDTNHMIIIEGNCWGNNYNGIFPLWDNNMTLSFHKYWNNNSVGSIQGMLNLRTQHNVPLWLGESGENSNVWFRDAIKLMESNNIGWAFWPLKKVESIAGIADVTKTAGYQNLLNYWGGTGAAPTADEATATLMELANNFNMANVKIKYDVIDAMFRQVNSDETIPYKNHPLPGKVYATEYDLGRYQYAYNDGEVATYHSDGGSYVNWNQGWSMRNDGVDIERSSDTGSNGFQVGYTNAGEWMVYTLSNETETAYDVDIRYAGMGGSLHLEDETGRISEVIALTSTGGYNTWSTVTINDVILKAGTSKVKVYIDSAGSNLNYFEFKNPVATSEAGFKVIDAATNILGDKVIVAFNKPLQTGINYTDSSLTLKVNGTVVAVSGFTHDGKTLTFTTATAINATDVVLLTYAGTNIVAADATAQAAFTDMPVANRTGTILQIPGTVQAESFYVNNGLQLENTSDSGAGQNIGYTDAGDSLEYLVNINEAGNYKIEYRTAGETQTGRVTLQLINATTQNIQTVSLNPTGAWQTWQTTVSQAQLPAGRYFMKVLIDAAGFNFNWMKFTATPPDDDFDGVPNTADLCPNTPMGSVVDFTGCILFTLPGNNFTVVATDETCRSSNNGSIAITSASNHNFVATLTGTATQTANFTTTTSLANLAAGTYQLCITLPEAPTYRQCYDIVIEEPRDLSVFARMASPEDKVVELDLYGGTIYTITLNDESFTTTRNTVSLSLRPGINNIEVKADNECQGIYKKSISLNSAAVVYPNPVSGNNLVNVAMPATKEKIVIEVYSALGNRVFVKEYNPEGGMPIVDMSQLQGGIYIMKIASGTYSSNVKIVKE
jgi:endoglucanase